MSYGYGGIKENIFLIAAIIYVGGMFLLFYVYQTGSPTVLLPGNSYSTIPTVTLLSTFGCFLLFLQLFVAVWKTPKERRES